MKKLKHSIVHGILFFYLISSYLGATHIHKEMFASHDDCKVCLVVKNINNADISSDTSLPVYEWTFFKYIAALGNIPAVYRGKGYNAQAPPSLF